LTGADFDWPLTPSIWMRIFLRMIEEVKMRNLSRKSRPIDGEPVAKKSTNLSLAEPLVAEAKSLGINLSRACERGLTEEIADRRAALWLEENREAIEAWNDYVEKNGLPLAQYRQF
jgi:antitoxin CcdA